MKAIKCKHMVLRPVCVLIAGAAKPVCYFANFVLLSIQLTMPLGSLVRWKLFYFTPAAEFAVTWEVTGLRLDA